MHMLFKKALVLQFPLISLKYEFFNILIFVSRLTKIGRRKTILGSLTIFSDNFEFFSKVVEKDIEPISNHTCNNYQPF